MYVLLISALVVALAEIGDKTQLLAIVLATRFRRPVPIILGILAATLANHALAATLGHFAAGILAGTWFQAALGASFIVMGLWVLVPDKADDNLRVSSGAGVFLATALAFFLVEMGDKTQVATIALGARFPSIALVTAGTTLGMMAANIPAVYLGQAATKVAPLPVIRAVAAMVFAAIGAWIVWSALA
jgi:putative Ca2+/H+ antiporter (TMEM165/GDT1 family)